LLIVCLIQASAGAASSDPREALWPPSFIDKFGSTGTLEGQFIQPMGIAVSHDGSVVYVADSGNQRINKFDGAGNFIMRWGSNGTAENQFKNPNGVTIDSQGNLYVVDTTNHRIQKFSSSETFVYTFGLNVDGGAGVFEICTSGCVAGGEGGVAGAFSSPYDVAVDGAGNVYVTDLLNHRIQKFDSSGNFLLMWGWGVDTYNTAFETCTNDCQPGISGNGDGQFNRPNGIAATKEGIIYVSDLNNYRVQKFQSNGTFVGKWGTGGSGPSQFNGIGRIDVDRKGNVYVPDRNERVQKFDAAGNFLLQWGSPGTGDGQFDNPVDVTVTFDGSIYVVDLNNDRVQRFAGPFYWLFPG
jgi:DNA-binding beta-propeller fold protein YncE